MLTSQLTYSSQKHNFLFYCISLALALDKERSAVKKNPFHSEILSIYHKHQSICSKVDDWKTYLRYMDT